MRAIATLSLLTAIAILLAGCKPAIAPPEGPNTGTAGLPEISLLHYRVALAHLDNDSGGQVEAQLRRAITDLDPSFSIQIVPYNATISASPAESDVAAARTFLASSGAQHIIGGSVIAGGGRQLVRLVIVGPRDNPFADIHDPAYFRFPALTAADSAILLRLVIADESVAHLNQGICGHTYTHLRPLFDAARSLADRTGADAYWDRDSNARLNFIVATALRSDADSFGSASALRRSLVYFLAAMADFAQSDNPHDSALAGWRFASALTQLGQQSGNPNYLSVSIDLARQTAALLGAQHDEVDSALAQDESAYALYAMPGADGRKDRLEQTLRIYQSVIARLPRETYPQSWQIEERNIATLMGAIGVMEPGGGNLDQSVAEFRALLAASPPGVDRAITEVEFGHVLTARAEREGSIDDFNQAISAERDAIKSLDPCFPLQAGDAENSLGLALVNLGTRVNSGDDTAQAALAFNSALGLYANFGDHEKIATAENNLAEAKRELGARSGSAPDLEAAVRSEREALRMVSRERDPLQWARIKARLARSLWQWGDQKSSSKLLEEAIAANLDALSIITPKNDLEAWRQTEADLGNALNSLANLEHGQSAIDDAQASLAAYQKVLATFDKRTEPHGWAGVEAAAGEALTTWGANESSNQHLEQAVDAFNQSLALINPHEEPFTWADVENDLGLALAILGEREAGTAGLERSATAFRQALTVLSKGKNDAQFKTTTDDLNDVLAELKKRGA